MKRGRQLWHRVGCTHPCTAHSTTHELNAVALLLGANAPAHMMYVQPTPFPDLPSPPRKRARREEGTGGSSTGGGLSASESPATRPYFTHTQVTPSAVEGVAGVDDKSVTSTSQQRPSPAPRAPPRRLLSSGASSNSSSSSASRSASATQASSSAGDGDAVVDLTQEPDDSPAETGGGRHLSSPSPSSSLGATMQSNAALSHGSSQLIGRNSQLSAVASQRGSQPQREAGGSRSSQSRVNGAQAPRTRVSQSAAEPRVAAALQLSQPQQRVPTGGASRSSQSHVTGALAVPTRATPASQGGPRVAAAPALRASQPQRSGGGGGGGASRSSQSYAAAAAVQRSAASQRTPAEHQHPSQSRAATAHPRPLASPRSRPGSSMHSQQPRGPMIPMARAPQSRAMAPVRHSTAQQQPHHRQGHQARGRAPVAPVRQPLQAWQQAARPRGAPAAAAVRSQGRGAPSGWSRSQARGAVRPQHPSLNHAQQHQHQHQHQHAPARLHSQQPRHTMRGRPLQATGPSRHARPPPQRPTMMVPRGYHRQARGPPRPLPPRQTTHSMPRPPPPQRAQASRQHKCAVCGSTMHTPGAMCSECVAMMG